jgi:aminopeptidase-like protein
MFDLINDLWYKTRNLVSDGYDESLEYISKIIPITIHKIKTGTECWTWIVPEKWEVTEAWIEDLAGNRLLDLKDHPLHVMSYSLPVDKTVTKAELMNHLHTRPDRPNAIPFEFKYYEKDWGFCIQHNKLKNFTDTMYKVLIKSTFSHGSMKIGEYTIPGKSNDVVVLVAHLDHPAMVNDDLTGVAVLIEIAKELKKQDNNYTYKILLLPETIGSIAYLSQNEEQIPNMKYGLFLEMLGNNNIHALQLSKQGNTMIDRIARYVLKKNCSFREDKFRKVISNDEMVFNGPGVNIPMISISRFPYPEYHTSDDNPSIVSEKNLNESKKIILEILRILDQNFIPKRKFKGSIFLSRYGLWVDYRTNKKLNENLEQIMLMLDGDKSVFDISEELGMDFYDVLDYINKFSKNNLIDRN